MSTPANNDETGNETATTGRQRVIDKIAARFRKVGRERTAAPSASHPPRSRAHRIVRAFLNTVAITSWAAVGGLTISSYLTEPLDNLAAEQSRSLTAGEADLARAMFGNDFETDSIRLRFHNGAPTHMFNNLDDDTVNRTLAYVNGTDTHNVHFINRDFHAHDYSRTDDMGLRGGVFMHELAHIWQNRTGRQAAHCDTYEYTLTPQSRFEDFCNEQQAEIIRDYVVRFVIPSHPAMEADSIFYAMAYAMGAKHEARLEGDERNLARVIETAFPHAAGARLRIQASFNRAAVCTVERMREFGQQTYSEQFNICAAQHVRTIGGQTLTVSAQAPVTQPPDTGAPPPPFDDLPDADFSSPAAKAASARPPRPAV